MTLRVSLFLFAAPALSAGDFETIRPVLETNCLECHGPEKLKGDLRLDTREGLIAGGENADAVNFEKPAESELLKRIRLDPGHDDFMPPSGKETLRDPLLPTEIAALEAWITARSPWPEGVVLEQKKKGPPLENPDETDPALAALAAYPEAVNLESRRDFHRLIVIATGDDAGTRDVTPSARLTVADPSIAKLEGTTLHPLKDGETSVKIDFRGKSIEVPVKVTNSGTDRPISFQQDVMPIFTASGCNTGSCHGSARGQDGFMLSLFGYDPKGDHFRLTTEMAGRRLNLAIPVDSLLLTKATGSVPHTGGKLFEKDHPFSAALLEWVQNGAKYDADDIALPVEIEVQPAQYVLKGPQKPVPLAVTARYSDGTDRDVTGMSLYSTSNDNSVGIDPNTGVAQSKNRGEAFLMARFHTFTEGSQAIVIPADMEYTKPDVAAFNYIDELVHQKLNKLRLIPSEVASDEVFIRRLYIDLVGLLPTVEEREKLLADTNPQKREALVDELLNRKEFTEIWVMKWGELLQIASTGNNANQVSYKAVLLWNEWLRERVAANQPFNETIRELLSSSGGTFENPATNYFNSEADVKKLTENVAQVFMGTRIQCAQCHNHPFDRWTQNDYYGFASFFSQVKKKRSEDPSEQIIFDGSGEIQHPLTLQNATPKFLGGAVPEDAKRGRRQLVANWLTAPENPWFAKNVSNIVWSHFFGRGIVEPVDDVRVSNPPSNPALLEALGEKMVAYNFDMRKLVRDICNSRTYQLSTRANATNGTDETNFSKANIRRVRAEVLLDMLTQTTGTQEKFQGLPMGSRAVQIADGKTTNFFLTTFGRSTRATVCSCEVKMDPNLSQALHLINGDSTHDRIQRGRLVQTWLKENEDPAQVVRQLYLRALGREPVADEVEKLNLALAESKGPEETVAILEDIFWALLNSKEFVFNH